MYHYIEYMINVNLKLPYIRTYIWYSMRVLFTTIPTY